VFEHERRDVALLRELGLTLRATLDTHVHADHVTGAWLLKQRCGSQIALSAAAGASHVDRALVHGERVPFGARHLEVRATPGHTDGCLTYVLDDHSMAFTGDSLLIRGCGRTDFQQGSPNRLFRSVREQILSLPPACLLYPGHDYRGLTVTSVAEELRFNRCGRRDGGDAPAAEPDWAPLTFTFGGIWEIQPVALHERIAGERPSGIQVVDVREPHEFTDALGHIQGARLLPLAELAALAGELDRERPVVCVCRSGTRSAQATLLLQQAGLDQVANLHGGMLRWRADALPVVGGAD
jgi:sulfur dioxygenase